MNIKYILKEVQALVFDENENITEKDITNNLDEILIQENKITDMENQLNSYEEELPTVKKEMNLHQELAVAFLVEWPIIFIIGLMLICVPAEISLSLGTIIKVFAISTIISCPVALHEYKKYSKKKNKFNGLIALIHFLKKELPKEYTKLEELKQIATKVKNADESTKMIFVNKQALQDFRNYLAKVRFYGEKIAEYVKNKDNYRLELQEQMKSDGITDLFDDSLMEQCGYTVIRQRIN